MEKEIVHGPMSELIYVIMLECLYQTRIKEEFCERIDFLFEAFIIPELLTMAFDYGMNLTKH